VWIDRQPIPVIPRPPNRLLRAVFTALIIVWLGGCAALPPPRAFVNVVTPGVLERGDRARRNVRVFDQVWDWVNRRYYDAQFNGADWAGARERHRAAALAATDDVALYTALNTMLAELHDAHAHALSPREVEEQERRHGVLIGFRTGPVGGPPGRRLIEEVFPGSPAATAGVQPGWVLVAADGRTPGEVLGVGKLHDGQVVHCEFLDDRETPRTLALKARKMSIPPVLEARPLADDIWLLRFDYFDLQAADWVRQQLDTHRKARGVIIDLRENRGGEGRALASILGSVMAPRSHLGTTIARGATPDAHRAPKPWFTDHYKGPLAVLVSDQTASAAEIMAHVVQYHHRGPIVGTTTSGHVLVSVFWWLPGGGELQLSVYDYRGPGGDRLEGRGVAPDVAVVPPGVRDRRAPDPVVEAAVAALHAQKATR